MTLSHLRAMQQQHQQQYAHSRLHAEMVPVFWRGLVDLQPMLAMQYSPRLITISHLY